LARGNADNVEKRLDVTVSKLSGLNIANEVLRGLFLGEGGSVRSGRGQRIVHVDDRDDLRQKRHLISTKSSGIPAAIEALVMT
jgi:hypothetical protein